MSHPFTIAKRRTWCEELFRTKEGARFSLEGRDWVTENIFRPLHQWRVVLNSKGKACDACRGMAWELVDWKSYWPVCEECPGTRLEPILFLILNIGRQNGKSLNIGAACLSEICNKRNRSVLFVASAGVQTENIFEDIYVSAVRQHPVLEAMCKVVGNRITVETTGSVFKYAQSSKPETLAGSSPSILVLDECRGMTPAAAASAAASVRATGGRECIKCWHNYAPGSQHVHCPRCGGDIVPWFPLVIMTSSSGLLRGSELDWFQRLVDQQAGGEDVIPHHSVHAFRSTENLNPNISEQANDVFVEVLSQVEELQDHIDAEFKNIVKAPGERFINSSAISACVDVHLANVPGNEDRCMLLLDTSTVGDLTSLIRLSEDSSRIEDEGAAPWDFVYWSFTKMWDPKNQPGKQITTETVEPTVRQVLEASPHAVGLWIDVRGGLSWAMGLYEKLKKEPQFAGRIRAIRSKAARQQTRDRATGWALLRQRFLARRIRIPNEPRIKKELMGIEVKMHEDGSFEIKDKKRASIHRELTESAAILCREMFLEQSHKKLSISDVNKSTSRRERGQGIGLYVGAGSLREGSII